VAGLELNRHLQKELKFWKAKGPTLRHGWINEDKSVHAPLRERYSVTYELILGLEKTRYTPALNTAIEFRGFWRSLPQLNDGFSEFIGECDKLIRDLRTSF